MSKYRLESLRTPSKVAAFVLAVSFGIFAPYASACSCFYLAYGFIGPYTSHLPANALGIPWYVSTKRTRRPWDDDLFDVDESRFSLEVLREGEFVPIPLHISVAQEFTTLIDTYMIYHIYPKDGKLKPGATYRVTDLLDPQRNGESHGDREVVVEIDLETLSVNTPLNLHVEHARVAALSVAASVSCSGWLKVSQARIAARLPGEFMKWEDQLLFTTIVNGRPWLTARSLCSLIEPGRGWDSVAHDRVFTACEEPSFSPIGQALAPGKHSVMVEARLPGTDIVLQTEKRLVDLACSVPPGVREEALN